jgi:hypothetical protein
MDARHQRWSPPHWNGIGKPSQNEPCGVKIDGVWLRITGDLAVGSLATGVD